ncbi:MAG: DinB family protein [Actinobacteria bacterium]|nr:DinB family protein [Actinomycetota bacterium]
MNEELNQIFNIYHSNWQLLYDLFEKLPEDKLNFTIGSNNRTLKQLLAHIAGIEKCYLEVIRIGADGWKHCHMEDERSNMTKDELLRLYKESHETLKKELKERNDEEKIDWTEGVFMSLKEHIFDLNNQSVFHQGQLVVYIRSLGEEFFPSSWSVWGY